MRKYKVWCKGKQEWEKDKVFLDDNGNLYQLKHDRLMPCNSFGHDVVYSTGLYDKNGKEIYERDIIKGLHDVGPAGFHEYTVVVLFCKIRGFQWQYWDLNTIEIIGNIYENPELLEIKGK